MDGNIPVIFVSAKSIPEAWEKAVIAVWEKGAEVRTEYDRLDKSGNYTDPPSRDATVMVEVHDPFSEPRIHKNFPGGPAELEVYRQEVIEGIHDHWVDPAGGRWTYTYHERLFKYYVTDELRNPKGARPFKPVNQIDFLIERLCKVPHTRRAQAITWMPTADPLTEDPPCLQRIWCRLLPDENGNLSLNMNSHWRSRDLYKAWFMNVYALTEFQKLLAEKVSERLKKKVTAGRYVDISDSLHIYGSYFRDFMPELDKMKKDPDWKKRSWRSDESAFLALIEETRERLKKDPDFMRPA